jgi:hypothetical protein
MAATPTPMLNELLISLAYKLRDPVQTANADGKIFFYKSRINYITRAYASLKRKLESILLNVEDFFPDFYTSIPITGVAANTKLKDYTIDLKKVFGSSCNQAAFGIYNVFAKLRRGEEDIYTKQLNKISPENYFQGLYDPSSKFYEANATNKKFFYSLIDGKIKFLADANTSVLELYLFVRNYVPDFQSDASVDIMIPVELHDVILNLAAYEAMLDLGNNASLNKAQMYNAEVAKELKVIQYKQEVMKREDSDRTAK